MAPAAPSAASPSPTPTATPPAAAPASDSIVKLAEPAAAPVTPATKAAKPDYIPDDLWDADKGFRADRAKELLELDTAERNRRGALPKSAAEYKGDLPDDVKLPEGASIDVENPRFKALAETAHAEGWSQKAFSKALGLEAQRVISEAAVTSAAIKARDDALGPNGPARADAITAFINATTPSADIAVQVGKMLTTVGIVEWIEKLQAAVGSQGIAALSRAPVTPAADPSKIEGWDNMSTKQQFAVALQRGNVARATR